MRAWRTSTEEETRALGRGLVEELGDDATILLFGDMGSGKTILTQGIADGLGIDPSEVQSPTYTLIREHRGAGASLVHIDLYRLEADEIEALGLEEIFERPAIRVVEWAERLGPTEAELRLGLYRGETPGERRISELGADAAVPRRRLA